MCSGAKNFQKSLDVCDVFLANQKKNEMNTEKDARSSLKTTFSLSRLIRCAMRVYKYIYMFDFLFAYE